MELNKQKILTYNTAVRQLNALLRKYNQTVKTNSQPAFKLSIHIDQDNQPDIISYTLIMKNHFEDAWEVRRVHSILTSEIQSEFTDMVTKMEHNLAEAIASRILGHTM